MATMAITMAIGLAVCLLLPACGPGGGSGGQRVGTVAIVNDSDQGMAPVSVEEFYLQPVGTMDPGSNLLAEDVLPGGVVLVGLFPPGFYNAVAVLDVGGNITFMDVEVRAGEPTNFVIPAN
jgi:hypothetical protein